MQLQQRPRQKRSHGMTQKHIGQPRILGTGQLQQPVAVGHGRHPAAAEVPGRAGFGDGLSMAHVILRHHREALGRQVGGKFVVAVNVLGNAVDDLKYRLRRALRRPAAGTDGSRAAGFVEKFRFHRRPSQNRGCTWYRRRLAGNLPGRIDSGGNLCYYFNTVYPEFKSPLLDSAPAVHSPFYFMRKRPAYED